MYGIRELKDENGERIEDGFYFIPCGVIDGGGVGYVHFSTEENKKSWMIEHFDPKNRRQAIFLFPNEASKLRRYDSAQTALFELRNVQGEVAEKQREFIIRKVLENLGK